MGSNEGGRLPCPDPRAGDRLAGGTHRGSCSVHQTQTNSEALILDLGAEEAGAQRDNCGVSHGIWA